MTGLVRHVSFKIVLYLFFIREAYRRSARIVESNASYACSSNSLPASAGLLISGMAELSESLRISSEAFFLNPSIRV